MRTAVSPLAFLPVRNFTIFGVRWEHRWYPTEYLFTTLPKSLATEMLNPQSRISQQIRSISSYALCRLTASPLVGGDAS